MNPHYIQLEPENVLPDITQWRPFLALVIIEESVTSKWRELTSQWLVKSGCLYMMAWGMDCSAWDAAVDLANIQQFNVGDIPEDELVVTTWQEDDPLKEVFYEAKNIVSHSCVELTNTLILHISDTNKADEFLGMYAQA